MVPPFLQCELPGITSDDTLVTLIHNYKGEMGKIDIKVKFDRYLPCTTSLNKNACFQ